MGFSAKVSQKVPEKGMDLSVLMVIIYYLNREDSIFTKKIHQDLAKKARLLSLLNMHIFFKICKSIIYFVFCYLYRYELI